MQDDLLINYICKYDLINIFPFEVLMFFGLFFFHFWATRFLDHTIIFSLSFCRIIVGKIDKDGDGQVTEQELKDWIQYVQKRYIVTDTDRMWKDHSIEGDKLSWSAYKQRTYGSDDGKYSFFVFLFSYQFHTQMKMG